MSRVKNTDDGEDDRRADQRRQGQGDAAEREAEIGRAQRAEHVLRLHAPWLQHRPEGEHHHHHAGDALQDDGDLRERIAAQSRHGQETRSNRPIRLEDGFGSVLGDDIGDVEGGADDAEVDRLIDEESGEGDVAGHGGQENDQRGRPAERSQGGPGLALRRSLRARRLRPELAHRVGDRDRGDNRADAPCGDRDIERGGGVGRRLDQPLDCPDRGKRHCEAIEDSCRPIADRNEPPGRAPRREHAAAKRIDGDQHARRLERGVDDPLHARIGEIKGVEPAGQHAEAGERQNGEDRKCPGGGKRTAQSARRGLAQIPIDKSTSNPAKRSDGQRKRDHDRGHADLGQQRPFADGAEPVVDEITDHPGVYRELASDSGPKLRIENAGRASERSFREQLTPRRADARADVVGLQQHGPRGAQVGVEPVVPLLLVLEVLGGDVRRGRRLTRFGRELVEALRRVRRGEASVRRSPPATRGQARRSGCARPASPCRRGSCCLEARFQSRSASPASGRGRADGSPARRRARAP